MSFHEPDSLYKPHLDHVKNIFTQGLAESGSEGVLIHSGSLKKAFLDDRNYPFIVNPHFNSWLPLSSHENCLILFRPDKKPVLFYMQPDDYWYKPPENPSGYWVDHWEIVTISDLKEAHNQIGDARKLSYIGENERLASEWNLGQVNSKNLLDHIHFERGYKTDYEIACLGKANEIAAKGHIEAENAFREGLSEFDIQHRYLSAIAHREQETPYSCIIGLNENAAVLHYQHYSHEKPSKPGSMLIDAGASYAGYAADVTRTWAFRDDQFQDLINLMDIEQEDIIDEIETGISYEDLHIRMHSKVARVLKEFELVKMSVDSMLEANITYSFFPHGLGHFLGLQTHDVGGYQASRSGEEKRAPDKYPTLRLTRNIENRQVFTIEPGLYFIDSLLGTLGTSRYASELNWEKIDSLRQYGGIRIEDNVAIIDNKTVNLTRSAFEKA